MKETKPFNVSKHSVAEAYKRVKANRGSAGVDNQSIEDFERNLKDNLYKIWNRMSSGCYFPPPVLRVDIPKKDGKTRPLGIPTVADRIAQMVVKLYLEPILEPHFHRDSYGYRPNKSALDAVGVARQRCWRYDWVIDIDIKGFFDNIDHELAMKAVKHHTDEKWILLYVERWLKAPIQTNQGNLEVRDKGTPQGGVISPLLANLYLHYSFDKWMQKNYPNNPFERYADDCIVHCRTEEEAINLLEAIKTRFAECKLELHPEKTKIVYCKDDDRKGNAPNENFDFLGYTFRPRSSMTKWGKLFVNFSPAISDKSMTSISEKMRQWKLKLRSELNLHEIAKWINPIIYGWINYYGKFYKSALYKVFYHLNNTLSRWVCFKYKKFKGHHSRAIIWLGKIALKEPNLFAHWKLGVRPSAG